MRMTSMPTSVLLIVGPKCTLTASHAAPGKSSHVEYAQRTLLKLEKWDRQTDGRQTVTLRFPLNVASVVMASVFEKTYFTYFSNFKKHDFCVF